MAAMNQKIQPQGPRVLVRRQPDAASTLAGLVIPESARSPGSTKPGRGVVEAVGRRRLKDGSFVELDVQVGERVVFSRLTGDDVDPNGDLVLVAEDEILCALDADTRVDPVSPSE